MALSEAKRAADKRHNAKLDQIMVRPYKEEGALIRSAAAARGQSVQSYVLEAVRARMEREQHENETPIEKRFPIERLGTEILKLERSKSGEEILRIEHALAGENTLMLFCNMTKDERAEWKIRRAEAVARRKSRT